MLTGTAEAAARLGISARRVQGLIASGQLRAESIGGRYLIDEDSLDLLADRVRRRGVRPLSHRVAWAAAAMADGVTASWLSSRERSRLRARFKDGDIDADAWVARMRDRAATEHRFRVGTEQMDGLLGFEAVRRSGTHARNLVTDLFAGSEDVVMWVLDEADLRDVVSRFGLLPSNRGNLTVRVARVDGLGAVGAGGGDAFRLIVAADLLDLGGARSRRAGEALLHRCLLEARDRVADNRDA
jgi:excisionase family DNA binding protein